MREKAAQMLQLRANNKLVQQRLCQETGKVILLKDLANIANRSRVQQSQNDLNETVDMLTEKYGRYYDLVTY